MEKKKWIRKFTIIILSLSVFSLSFLSSLALGQVLLQHTEAGPSEYISKGTLLLAVVVSSLLMFIIFKLLLFADERLFTDTSVEKKQIKKT